MANPTINLGTGITPSTQIPLDSKLYFKTLAEMRDLGTDDFKAFLYYEGMIIFCLQTKQKYIWRTNEPTLEVIDVIQVPKILLEDYVYPVGSESNEIDYSLREFNFYLYESRITLQNAFYLQNFSPNLANAVLEGRGVWAGVELNFYATPIKYRWNNDVMTAPSTSNFELLPAAAGLKRIDVFAIDVETNRFIVIPGDEAVSPTETAVDFTRQMRINAVLIDETTTPVGPQMRVVYKENLGQPTEFDVISGQPVEVINPNDPSIPYEGVKAISFKSPGRYDGIECIHNDPIEMSDFSYITMWYNGVSVQQGQDLAIYLLDLATGGIALAQIRDGEYGYDMYNPTYQQILVPKEAFDVFDDTATFDTVAIYCENGALGTVASQYFTLDNIIVTNGMIAPTPQSTYRLRSNESGHVDLLKDGILQDKVILKGKEQQAITEVDLSSVALANCDLENANGSLSYNVPTSTAVVPERVLNGRAVYLINTLTPPLVTGARQESGIAHIPSTNLHMFFWNKGYEVVYCFIPLTISTPRAESGQVYEVDTTGAPINIPAEFLDRKFTNFYVTGTGGGGALTLPNTNVLSGTIIRLRNDSPDSMLLLTGGGQSINGNLGQMNVPPRSTISVMRVPGIFGDDWVLVSRAFDLIVATATRTLTPSEINNIGTTPIEIVPAPGAGLVLSVINMKVKYNAGTVSYDANNLIVGVAGAANGQAAYYMDGTFTAKFTSSVGQGDLVENSALTITGTDSVAVGDSSIEIYINYEIFTKL